MNAQEKIKLTKPDAVRVRMAPSPTGLFHIGSARTALFNYLFARKNSGVFVLRIEDTDRERSKPVYEDNIIESLKWLGLDYDEGPGKGNYGPYRQSERGKTYSKYLDRLLDKGKAYRCFCSEDELKAQREYQMSIGQAPKYSGKCSGLSKSDVERNLKENKPHVFRFRIPAEKIWFEDIVRGRVEFDGSLMGDIVIAKQDRTPLYNFANVVDDFEMKISHVIRGEEHISNTPKQIFIQRALGLPEVEHAHLPLILGTDKSKLSKRHGAVSVLEYKEQGYLPEALVNFMAFLGWNPGTEKEIFSLDSLSREFSLERVQKAGAVFNSKRLDFLNGFYIRQTPLGELTGLCVPYLIQQGLIEPEFREVQSPPAYGAKQVVPKYFASETKKEISFDFLKNVVGLYKERLKKLSEIAGLADFFFTESLEYGKELLKWKDMSAKELKASLDISYKTLSGVKDFAKTELTDALMEQAEKFSKKTKREGDRGCLLWPLRVALTGKKNSAPPFDVAEILGKEESLKRIKKAKEML